MCGCEIACEVEKPLRKYCTVSVVCRCIYVFKRAGLIGHIYFWSIDIVPHGITALVSMLKVPYQQAASWSWKGSDFHTLSWFFPNNRCLKLRHCTAKYSSNTSWSTVLNLRPLATLQKCLLQVGPFLDSKVILHLLLIEKFCQTSKVSN